MGVQQRQVYASVERERERTLVSLGRYVLLSVAAHLADLSHHMGVLS